MRIKVNVKPNAKKELVEQIDDTTFTVKVNRPPADGEANARVIELLAEHFNCAKSKIAIVAGFKSKNKVVEVSE